MHTAADPAVAGTGRPEVPVLRMFSVPAAAAAIVASLVVAASAAAVPAAAAGATTAAATPGVVVAWGENDSGESTPPAGLSGVTAVSAGADHGLALKADGTVVGWGDDSEGEATPPPGLTGVTAISAGNGYSLAVRSNGTVVEWGVDPRGLVTPPAGLTGVVAVAAGFSFALALRADGTVVAWGQNNAGQATVPAGLTNVVAISAGTQHALAVKSDGTLVGWGSNYLGISTPPPGLGSVTAAEAGWDFSVALRSDGTVAAWGGNRFGQTSPPEGLGSVVAISASLYHVLALTAEGTVVGWGDDDAGQAGPPTGLGRVTSIAAGHDFSLAAAPSVPPPPPTLTGVPSDTVYGDTFQATVGQVQSGWTASLQTYDPQVCAISGFTVRVVGVGYCFVRAAVTDARGVVATSAWAGGLAERRPLTITASSQTLKQPAVPAPVVASFSGLANGDLGPQVAPTCATSATAQSDPGQYVSYCRNADDPHYAIRYDSGVVTVLPATRRIVVAQGLPPAVSVGRGSTIAATLDGAGKHVAFSVTVTPTVCAVTDHHDGTADVTTMAVGRCQVDVVGTGGARWSKIRPVRLSMNVQLIWQAIVFTSTPPSRGHNTVGSTYEITAAGGRSGDPVTFTSTTPAVCSVSDTGDGRGTVGLLAAGTCRVRADQAGNSTYSAARPVQQAFVVR